VPCPTSKPEDNHLPAVCHYPPCLTEIIGLGGVDWIHLAQDRDQWRAPVNMVMNLQVT
jgi:hypothetical protein